MLLSTGLEEFGGPNSLRWGDCNNPNFHENTIKVMKINKFICGNINKDIRIYIEIYIHTRK